MLDRVAKGGAPDLDSGGMLDRILVGLGSASMCGLRRPRSGLREAPAGLAHDVGVDAGRLDPGIFDYAA